MPALKKYITSGDTFKALKKRYPKTDTARRKELLSIREQFTKQD
jgi:hypothetical protein